MSRKLEIRILRDRCVGSQACVRRASELFSSDDEGKAVYRAPAGGNADEDLLRSVAASCPSYAIDVRVTDADDSPNG